MRLPLIKALLLGLLLVRWAAAQDAAAPCATGTCAPPPCGYTPPPVERYVPRCSPQSTWITTGCCPLPPWAYNWKPRCGPLPCPTQLDQSCVRWWVRTDYLLWNISDSPINVPLVTTSTAGFPTLNNPTTTVLYGNNFPDLGSFSGGRLTLGRWFSEEQCWGIEADAFVLARRSNNFTAGSDLTGTPSLGLPFSAGPLELVQPVSQPGVAVGALSVANSARLWGTETNLLRNLYRHQFGYAHLMTGFRYLDLSENLRIDTASAALAGSTIVSADSFSTRNQFYGFNMGLQGGWQWGRATVDITKQLALGVTQQSININGQTVTTIGGVPIVVPAGVYTANSGAGLHTRNQFNAIPQVQVRFGYAFTNCLRATLGYDAIFFGQTVRPGEQIQRNLLAASPTPLFNRSDMWAHGVSFGMDYRY